MVTRTNKGCGFLFSYCNHFFVRRTDYFGTICQSNHNLSSGIKFRVLKVQEKVQKDPKFSDNSMFLSGESNSFSSQLFNFCLKWEQLCNSDYHNHNLTMT